MNVLAFATLVVTGFVSCAEFGSYAFVHPVIRRLPQTEHLRVEQGLLKTFGRVMPVGMTLCVVLAISLAVGAEGDSLIWRWLAAAAFVLALVSTVVFNVPINLATGKWDAQNPPAAWKETRNKWEFFQGLRSWLLLIGFVLICVGESLA
ncbi:MAG: anthrone oxygenase family protein [Geodermatophilaceae bacterium]